MSFPRNLPECFKIVAATPGPVTTNGGVVCDYISLKHAHKVWIVLQFRQAVSHATVITPRVATAVAGTGAEDAEFTSLWWKNADVSTSDDLTEQARSLTMALTAGTTHQEVIIEIDPDQIPATNGDFDVLGCNIEDSSQATNFVAAFYIIAPRYKGDASRSPSVIVD